MFLLILYYNMIYHNNSINIANMKTADWYEIVKIQNIYISLLVYEKKPWQVSSFEEKDTKITATDTHEIINLQGTKNYTNDHNLIITRATGELISKLSNFLHDDVFMLT